MPRVQLPATTPKRRAWNKGRIIGQKRPLLPKQVWAIRARLELSENTREAVLAWVRSPEMFACRFMFPSRFHDRPHISTRQYGRLVRDWVIAIGLEPGGYGTHSLRRTKAAEIYRKTGNLRAVQLLLGHTKVDSTVRYLGVELEDALSIAERIDI
ncbi:tyrosine-type recombinase/integrase [Ruegeria sp. A3M17]|uniref:tyrosine-type recombinase/integrase n=1 Tax=Ruegeria sp. A3M17 TaxID=2267229 RepID=UPI000DEAC2ED|nr:tyrosine-type recombinase/integrase [Ruegeria sp. A3M17]RBW52499.1 integrase [Ruegeria sp. A3M17]